MDSESGFLPDIEDNGTASSWRRALLVSIPITAVVGQYLLPLPIGGIEIYAYRIVSIVALPTLMIADRCRLRLGSTLFWAIMICGGVWIAWGTGSILWAANTKAALADLAAVMLGWLSIIVIVQAGAGDASLLTALRKGWIVGFAIAVGVAAWELKTGHHLKSSFTEEVSASVLASLIAISTFGNPNNFAAFLLLTVPILLWEATVSRNILVRSLVLSGIPIAAALSILAGARLAMLGFVAEGAMLILALGVRKQYRFRVIVGSGIVGLSVAVFMLTVPAAARDASALMKLSDELSFSGSATIRLSMLRSGMLMIEQTGGIGVGAGNFPDAIRAGRSIGYTGGVVNPHNFGMEVAAQYGLIVAFLFLGFMTFVAVQAWKEWLKARLIGDRRGELEAAVLLSMLVGYVFAASENSAYINQPVNWTMLGTIAAMLDCLRRRGLREVRPGTAPTSLTDPPRQGVHR